MRIIKNILCAVILTAVAQTTLTAQVISTTGHTQQGVDNQRADWVKEHSKTEAATLEVESTEADKQIATPAPAQKRKSAVSKSTTESTTPKKATLVGKGKKGS
jgi:hypothetical protein